MQHPDTNEQRRLANAGLQLIPLHRWDSRSAHKGKERADGKRPCDNDWPRRAYDNTNLVARAERDGINLGVRLTAEQLVVDVDPRAFPKGRNPLAELSAVVGVDLRNWTPRTETGGGGFHLWMTKPAAVSVVDALPDFPGVEFKTRGRQVVAPGSIHPNGNLYVLVDPLEEIGSPDAAPPVLLEMAARTRHAYQSEDAGSDAQLSPEEVASVLSLMKDVDDYDDWIAALMSCHTVSGGMALAECQAWSYDGDAEEVASKWAGFDSSGNGNGRRGWGTLKHLARKYGGDDAELHCLAMERVPAAEDFAGDDLPDWLLAPDDRKAEEPADPVEALVDGMNRKICCTIDGGGFAIYRQEFDPVLSRKYWRRMSRETFRHFYEDETVAVMGSRPKTKADVWLAHPKRRKYNGIVFDPQNAPQSRGMLNLWSGWNVGEPAPGATWKLTRSLIEDVLCDGDPATADYVMRWIAFMFQRPWEPAQAAICFRGGEGTGKGTLGRLLMDIAGPHGMQVASSNQLTGRFNSHLRDLVFLFGDEAVWGGDKQAEGMLKSLVTERALSFEAKGQDVVMGPNRLHVMLASNEDWVVPAGKDARRFMVQDVSDAAKGDHAFWAAINAEQEAGGKAAMFYELRSMELGDWKPWQSIPKTQALADQKVQSLKPVEKFWLELLSNAELPVPINDDEWRKGSVTVRPADKKTMLDALDLHLKRNRVFSVKATHKALMQVGSQLGVESVVSSGGMERVWVLPPLAEMRGAFERMVGSEGLFD